MAEPSNSLQIPRSLDDDEISILDLFIVFAKYKIMIFGLPFLAAVIAAGYSLTLANIYTASTQILPPQSQSSASTMLAQLGGSLPGILGIPAKSSSDIYIAMLRSRTVADRLSQRLKLMKLYDIDAKYPSDLYRALEDVTNITSGKEGIITIQVDDKDPKFAADLANAYVDELLTLTSVLALNEASQRRLFFERQFALAKDNLSKVEITARQALESGGLVKVDDQGRSMLENSARLRAQITVKEVQIGAMRTFAADRNPELQLARQELESMKRELARIEGVGGIKLSTTGKSGQGTESLRLLRDVKYHEVIFELLAKQYEMAKIDEAKESSVVQILDKAIEPDRRSKPRRTVFVLIWAMAALLFAIVLAFIREEIAKAREDEHYETRIQSLKKYLIAWR